jgi:hypothetical protein
MVAARNTGKRPKSICFARLAVRTEAHFLLGPLSAGTNKPGWSGKVQVLEQEARRARIATALTDLTSQVTNGQNQVWSVHVLGAEPALGLGWVHAERHDGDRRVPDHTTSGDNTTVSLP